MNFRFQLEELVSALEAVLLLQLVHSFELFILSVHYVIANLSVV